MKFALLETENFKLSYPKAWEYDLLDDYIHSIFDKDGLGAFQISSYSSNNPEMVFDIEKEKLDFENPEIKDYGNLKAIIFFDTTTVIDFVVVRWIIGKTRTKIFCTYTIAKSDFNSDTYKSEFQKIENVIKTITIK